MAEEIAVTITGDANIATTVSGSTSVDVSTGVGVSWDDITGKPSNIVSDEYPTGGSVGNVLKKTATGMEWGSGGEGASSWSEISDKPFVTIGSNLLVANGVLSVDTATAVQQDNTKPVTSAAVHTEIGNIEALMATI